MCRADVHPEAHKALADLLRDLATALDPEHPESVQVGPVDFGTESNLPDGDRVVVTPRVLP